MIYTIAYIPHQAIIEAGSARGYSSVEARCWLEAKSALGFPLSPLQQRMLRGEASPFEISGLWAPGFSSQARRVVAKPQPTPLADPTAAFLASLTSDREVMEEQS